MNNVKFTIAKEVYYTAEQVQQVLKEHLINHGFDAQKILFDINIIEQKNEWEPPIAKFRGVKCLTYEEIK